MYVLTTWGLRVCEPFRMILTFDGLLAGGGGGAAMELEEVAGLEVSVDARRLKLLWVWEGTGPTAADPLNVYLSVENFSSVALISATRSAIKASKSLSSRSWRDAYNVERLKSHIVDNLHDMKPWNLEGWQPSHDMKTKYRNLILSIILSVLFHVNL